ncbi:MAG: N-(5'-phosphoribosyl)anthranilate isomerase [Pseudomonadota bacterium]
MAQSIPPDIYIARIFDSQAARRGAVIRRKIRDIEHYAGRDLFLQEMRRRGYTTVENAGQFVVFCNREPLRRLT